MKHRLLTTMLAMVLAASAVAQDFVIVNGNGMVEPYQTIPIDQIDSITYDTFQNPMLPEQMAKDENISLFCEAMFLTGVNNLMYWFNDESYKVDDDFTTWNNPSLVRFTFDSNIDNVAYPSYRYYKYTVFAETNDVFAAKGIHNLEDLKAYAKQVYDAIYPEDAAVDDPTDRRNSLNRFVAYHILNRHASYYELTAVDGPNSTLAKNFNRDAMDISDWYETMMPHASMKFSFPNGSEEGLYINRRGVQDRADAQGMKVRGAKVIRPQINNTHINGLYYYVDDIVCYTPETLGGELWRVDATTLSPDFMIPVGDGTNARGHWTRSNIEMGKYATNDSSTGIDNTRTCVGFMPPWIENFQFANSTFVYVRPRTLTSWDYQGDAVYIGGYADVTIKLPPLPNGTYEIRQGALTNFASFGAVQYYLDDVLQGEFVPLCLDATTLKSGEVGSITFNPSTSRYSKWDDLLKAYINSNLIKWGEYSDIDPSTHMLKGYVVQLYYVQEDVQVQRYQKEIYNEETGGYEPAGYTYTNLTTGEAMTEEEFEALQERTYQQAIELFSNHLKADAKNWLDGPAEYGSSTSEAGSEVAQWFSQNNSTLRRVIGRIESDGKTDHYLRIKQTMGSAIRSCLLLDYLEFVPVSLLDADKDE